jgi:hypothetical protein
MGGDPEPHGCSRSRVTMAVALVANELHYVNDTDAGLCAAIVLVLSTVLIVEAVADLGWAPCPLLVSM